MIKTDRSRIEAYQRPRKKESRTKVIWYGIIQRCTNPNNKRWKDYGGRGITVCKRWLKFENFLADMGEAPNGKSLDRVDNGKGYAPFNCRWATPLEQQANMRTNRKLTFNGETLHLSEWARRLGVHNSTLCKRITVYGMSDEEALTKPFPLKATALPIPQTFHCERCASDFESSRPQPAYASCCNSQHWNRPWYVAHCAKCNREWTVKAKDGQAKQCLACGAKQNITTTRKYAEVINAN